jgi:hypothetical protein
MSWKDSLGFYGMQTLRGKRASKVRSLAVESKVRKKNRRARELLA